MRRKEKIIYTTKLVTSPGNAEIAPASQTAQFTSELKSENIFVFRDICEPTLQAISLRGHRLAAPGERLPGVW